MILWLLIVLAAAAAVCFFVDAVKPQAWTARGLFLLALSSFIWLLNQAV